MKAPPAPPRPTGANPGPSPVPPPAAATSSAPLRLEAGHLVVPPIRLHANAMRYASGAELRIALDGLAPGEYRVVAVHNFHVEDTNPCLDEAVAGVFLAARRADGGWEAAERFPVECRTLAALARLVVGAEGTAELLPP